MCERRKCRKIDNEKPLVLNNQLRLSLKHWSFSLEQSISKNNKCLLVPCKYEREMPGEQSAIQDEDAMEPRKISH